MAPIQPQSPDGIRPPVVVVLGHVDHGKTKLLDTIRKTNVAEGESGGITQHIGAYQATVNNKLITFLDTPGHEAFTAIRSRGAKVADIAILVVAADESVKPQTKEAIRIIKEEKISAIIAINKIDREGANPQKVKQDLAAEDMLVEDWGGNVPAIEISAKEGQGIPELLDMILLVAELAELKEDRSSPAQGVIIESHLDKRRGYIATALVKKGILHIGDWITVGTIVGKVKSMEDFTGVAISEAAPSQPVILTGWSDAPDIGKIFTTSSSKEAAEDIRDENIDLTPLFSFFTAAAPEPNQKKTLNVVFKSDVASSLEAIESALKAISSSEVHLNVLDYGVGNVSEGDIKTALNNQARIFGFRVATDGAATKLAEKNNITISSYDIIYELINAVRDAMADLLDPEVKRTILGKLRILALFKKDGKSQILGGRVTTGKLTRGVLVDCDTKKIGKITQLQHNKEEVSDVKEGLECGLRIDMSAAEREIKVGDILEAYEEEKVKRSL